MRKLSGKENCHLQSLLSRRDFCGNLGAGFGVVSFAGLGFSSGFRPNLIMRFMESLDPSQRKALCFPYDHPSRTNMNPARALTTPRVAALSVFQRSLCREIFKSLCTDQGYPRFLDQMRADFGGFENYHPLIYGESATDGPFEWVLAGRHLTIRGDGNRIDGAVLRGSVFFGDSGPSENLWKSPGDHARTLLETLDRGQRLRAFGPGLVLSELDVARQTVFTNLLKDLRSPFRGMSLDRFCGSTRLVYDSPSSRAQCGVAWKVESPGFSCVYHSIPHVHVWMEIQTPTRLADAGQFDGRVG